MIDIHCHILPGVDHGSQSLAESQAMLAAAAAAGITDIVATPHVYTPDLDTEGVRESWRALLPYAQELNITLRQGFECNISALEPTNLGAARRFCIQGTHTLLLEFPFESWPSRWEDIIYDLQANGMQLIIVHPERYLPVQRNLSMLETMLDMGCYLQVNASSYGKLFGKRRSVVERIEKLDALHFIATDAHIPEHYGDFDRVVGKPARRKLLYYPDALPDALLV